MRTVGVFLIVLLVTVSLWGCGASTPFTSGGIQKVLAALGPALLEARGVQEGQGPEDATSCVAVALSNVARGIWPFSACHVVGDELTVVFVFPPAPRGECPCDQPDRERDRQAGRAALQVEPDGGRPEAAEEVLRRHP